MFPKRNIEIPILIGQLPEHPSTTPPANDDSKMAAEDAPRLPREMLSFVLRQGELARAGLRLGQLTIQGRPAIATPALIACTSRGVIPHVTQDVLSKLTCVAAVYIGLEDCTCIYMPAWRKLTTYLQPMVSH